ncbi:MAG: hypothetical protein KDI47_06455 [Gammaproteobacteria bacterium]|nr:hypothetical protein [Gammaproteobacteria bacterium]MCB1880069.1 hypothetical protein [Gammaproteobacteria bacterium]MCB1904682.1 hypothetical protein [Gammaproteobacteria bacterium]
MELTEKERRFLDKRRKLLTIWPPAGYLLLAMLALLAGWLFWSAPLLVNPHLVWAGLQSGSITEANLQLMAGMLPVVTLLLLVVCLIVVLFVFAAFSNEKRELKLIDRLLQQ